MIFDARLIVVIVYYATK